ncbi:MAG: hypothetical protein Q9213_005532 [Squamulea squamosa]
MLNLFVSQKEINKLKADLQLRQNAAIAFGKAKRLTYPLHYYSTPYSLTTYRPPKQRKAAALSSTDPATPAAEATPAPEAPAEPAPPAEKAPWTTAEDIAVLHLKGEGKSFAEIANSLAPRDEAEVETRWKEIGLPAATAEGGDGAPAPTSEPAKTNDAKGQKGQKGGKQKGGGGGGQQKGEGKQKGKGKGNQGGKPNEQPAEDAPTDPFTDAAGAAAAESNKRDEAVVANKRDQKVRGILKRGVNGGYQEGNLTIPTGATNLNGRPIIYIEENDPLNIDEISMLYHMHMGFEEQRWIRMASKFFDQTGKRIEPEWLKEKLQNCRR